MEPSQGSKISLNYGCGRFKDGLLKHNSPAPAPAPALAPACVIDSILNSTTADYSTITGHAIVMNTNDTARSKSININININPTSHIRTLIPSVLENKENDNDDEEEVEVEVDEDDFLNNLLSPDTHADTTFTTLLNANHLQEGEIEEEEEEEDGEEEKEEEDSFLNDLLDPKSSNGEKKENGSKKKKKKKQKKENEMININNYDDDDDFLNNLLKTPGDSFFLGKEKKILENVLETNLWDDSFLDSLLDRKFDVEVDAEEDIMINNDYDKMKNTITSNDIEKNMKIIDSNLDNHEILHIKEFSAKQKKEKKQTGTGTVLTVRAPGDSPYTGTEFVSIFFYIFTVYSISYRILGNFCQHFYFIILFQDTRILVN